MRAHKYYKCPGTCEYGCQFCDGGLGFCEVCNGFEGTLPSECPGTPMKPWQSSGVWKGVLDFHDGKWHYGYAQKNWEKSVEARRRYEARRQECEAAK